jgi:hypothetical protein
MTREGRRWLSFINCKGLGRREQELTFRVTRQRPSWSARILALRPVSRLAVPCKGRSTASRSHPAQVAIISAEGPICKRWPLRIQRKFIGADCFFLNSVIHWRIGFSITQYEAKPRASPPITPSAISAITGNSSLVAILVVTEIAMPCQRYRE